MAVGRLLLQNSAGLYLLALQGQQRQRSFPGGLPQIQLSHLQSLDARQENVPSLHHSPERHLAEIYPPEHHLPEHHPPGHHPPGPHQPELHPLDQVVPRMLRIRVCSFASAQQPRHQDWPVALGDLGCEVIELDPEARVQGHLEAVAASVEVDLEGRFQDSLEAVAATAKLGPGLLVKVVVSPAHQLQPELV